MKEYFFSIKRKKRCKTKTAFVREEIINKAHNMGISLKEKEIAEITNQIVNEKNMWEMLETLFASYVVTYKN